MSDRRAYLANQAALKLLSEAERLEYDAQPLVIQNYHDDGTPAGLVIFPRSPELVAARAALMDDKGNISADDELAAWCAAGQGRDAREVKAEMAAAKRNQQSTLEHHRASMADAMTADQPARVNTSPIAEVPTPQPATAAPQSPTPQPAKQEWELDARGNRTPKKNRWWIKPA